MAQSSFALTLGNISVRQLDGLFSLNDLHKASGSNPSQRPGNFLGIDQTKALIAEIETAEIPAVTTREGRNGGTYACRELVIAYAAWISATFHLKVIRVFLDSALPTTITPAQAQHLRELVELVVESGKQSHGETWARLHRKMHVNSYLALRPDQFDAACQYLRGKFDDTSLALLVQKHFPQAVAALPAPADHMPTMRGRRWIMSLDWEGRESVTPVPEGAMVYTWAQVLHRVAINDELPSGFLLELANAAMGALYKASQASAALHIKRHINHA